MRGALFLAPIEAGGNIFLFSLASHAVDLCLINIQTASSFFAHLAWINDWCHATFQNSRGEKSQVFKFHVANFGDLSFGIKSLKCYFSVVFQWQYFIASGHPVQKPPVNESCISKAYNLSTKVGSLKCYCTSSHRLCCHFALSLSSPQDLDANHYFAQCSRVNCTDNYCVQEHKASFCHHFIMEAIRICFCWGCCGELLRIKS